MKSLKYALALAVAVLGLSGCAGTATKSAPERPETADVRAQSRWNALIAKDYAKAFEYLSPGARSELTADKYAAQMSVRPVKWKTAKVGEVDCDQEASCRVDVAVEFEVPSSLPGVGPVGSTSTVSERWVQLDGVWYHVPRHIARGR